jgi:hypothetical protein
LSWTAGGRILSASYVVLADDLGLPLITQFEGVRTKRHAGAAADTSLLINFYHVIFLNLNYKFMASNILAKNQNIANLNDET